MTEASSRAAWRARLLELLTEKSVRHGHFTLASGKQSDFYVDCKQTTLTAEGSLLVGRLVFAEAQKLRQSGTRMRGVGGLTLGADPIAVATALVSRLDGNEVESLDAFVIRKEPKGHGTRAWLEGSSNLPEGSPVLIVEDVVTTAGSTLKAIARAKESGLCPTAVVALIDRNEGGREALTESGLPFVALFARADFEAR